METAGDNLTGDFEPSRFDIRWVSVLAIGFSDRFLRTQVQRRIIFSGLKLKTISNKNLFRFNKNTYKTK